MGGLREDAQRRELRKVLRVAGLNAGQNTYEFRSAINTEMDAAGVSLLVQRYVTGHRTDDIQNHYVSLQPDEQMRRYFDSIAPLLDTIQRKGTQLGLKI